jgi:hypothetical protein
LTFNNVDGGCSRTSTSGTSQGNRRLPLQLPKKSEKMRGEKDMLTPHASSRPLPRWAQGHYRYPVDRVPPHTSFKSKTRSKMYWHIPSSSDTATCSVASDPASLLGSAPTLPHVLRLRTLPPCSGGLRRCHMSHGFGLSLPTREGFGVAACPAASNPASLLRRALNGPWTSGIKKGLAGLAM